MTYLKLKRLIITKGGQIVYDETFHHKINIIRGENGSGKSTIANFIYYSLGGDFVEWLPEARSCDFVFSEVEINNKILTLKREVIDKIMQPMQIFFGELDQALKSAADGWLIYPYRKSENKESFSQLLFRLLNFPEVTTENNESITMNQILRLLYIDQMSPLISFIRNVDFDSPLIRQAIGNLVLGIYDDELFNQQLELRNKRRRFGEMKNEFQAVRDIYKRSNQTIDLNEIDSKIKSNETQIQKIDETLAKRELVSQTIMKNEVFKKLRELQAKVESTSEEIRDLLNSQGRTEAEIIDSRDFIKELYIQNNALNESLSTRQLMGELTVGYCPSCLSKLDPVDDETICHLCKSKLNDSDNRSRILRIQHEIQTQIKESEYLLDKKAATLKIIEDDISVLKGRLNLENRNLNNYIQSTNSTIDRKYDELLIKKGELNNEILNLLNQKQLIATFLNLKGGLDRLDREIKDLDEIVRNKEAIQRKNMNTALEKIKYYSLILIKGDGDYEAGFINASRIEIDFSKNLYYVDERNNFSASSLVILKNSIRFGIFFASIELGFMRYPRFILCDNIEDKGMREERSHNFQKNLINLANGLNSDFQIIFTTSMIDSSIEIPDYTVGEHYYPTKKSLKV
jgi:AAA domain